MRRLGGFTLIELVVVIVIISILAIIAVPKYIDITSEAKVAATNGVAAGLSSANAINYAVRKVNAAKGVAITNCTGVSAALSGGLPTGYVITAAAVAVDTTVTCTVTNPDGTTTATFTATGIS